MSTYVTLPSDVEPASLDDLLADCAALRIANAPVAGPARPVVPGPRLATAPLPEAPRWATATPLAVPDTARALAGAFGS